ncbi:hypothetical protein [Pantanalinema sp. GBBB05]|uniref:hypothetical protein n=1 Tax=Pantanalinema sp. GBBB05 TaxID=2604139 RepID=UPI001DEDAC80|nr:hypothetical protein [Pantanalinema sp. GBBB05]
MTNERVSTDTYDRGIVPAETAARKEREGEEYKHTPERAEDIDTTGGFTVDREGLLNNYAIEPEMYYEEPGDLRAKEEAEAAAREAELADINDNDETGKLTMEDDTRGKGSGIV